MQNEEEVREETGFASSPILNMSTKTQAGIVAGFLGVPALILADMFLGLADWMIVPEVAGVALVAGVANYALKKSNIDLKAQWRDLDWGSLVGAPREEQDEVSRNNPIEDDDLSNFKLGPVEPVDPVTLARRNIVPPGQERPPILQPTSRLLDLGDILQIDIDDWVCKSKFVCGIRRSGKTTLGCRIIEEEAKHSIPMFIADRKRDYISLAEVLPRAMVLGKDNVTLESAKKISTAIFEENYQVILDLASFIEDFDTGCAIATEIVKGLMAWALEHPRDKRCCEVVLDECQAFFPQSGSSLIADNKIYQKMLSTYGNAIAQGGSLGIGTIILTQRIAETNKKVIGQSELLFLLKQTMPNDLDVYKTLTDVSLDTIKSFQKGQGVFVDYEGVSHIVQFHNRTSDGSMSASPRASSVLKPISKPVTRQNFAYASSLTDEEEDEIDEREKDNFRRKMREERESYEMPNETPISGAISQLKGRLFQAQKRPGNAGNGTGNDLGNGAEIQRETDNASHVAFMRDIAKRIGNGESPVEIRKSLGVNSGRAVQDVNAVLKLLDAKEPSPIEESFWSAWCALRCGFDLAQEYRIDKYRVDFAYIPGKIAIELDGHATHSSPTDIANDRRRQRDLEALGWRFLRFGGQEVYQDADACARQTYDFIKKHGD